MAGRKEKKPAGKPAVSASQPRLVNRYDAAGHGRLHGGLGCALQRPQSRHYQ